MIGLRLRAAVRANLIVFAALVVAFVAGTMPTATATYLMFTLFMREHHRLSPVRTRWSTRIAPRSSSIASSPKSRRTTA